MSTNAKGQLQVQVRTNSLRVNTQDEIRLKTYMYLSTVSMDNMYQTFLRMSSVI